MSTNWQLIAVLAVVYFILLEILKLVVVWLMLKRKLQQLEMEEVLLLQLIKDTQKRCFIDNKISMGEYYDTMKQFETKLSKVVERVIVVNSKKTNLFTFRPDVFRLKQERAKLIQLVRDAQKEYFQQGLVDARIYQTKSKSLGDRLAKLEKEIVLKEATRAIKQSTGWQKPVWRVVYSVWK